MRYFYFGVPAENVKILIAGNDGTAFGKAKFLLRNEDGLNVFVIAENFSEAWKKLAQENEKLHLICEKFTLEHVFNFNFVINALREESLADEIQSITKSSDIRTEHIFFPEKNTFTTQLPHFYSKKRGNPYRKTAFQLALLFIAVFVGYGLSSVFTFDDVRRFAQEIPNEFYGMLLVGFFAQLVDGAVGLGYGVTCATSMMLLGIKLPAISGSIHTAEMFSSAVSGYSHYRFGNVNKKLLLWLAGSGVAGAVFGALLLTWLGNNYENLTYGLLASYTFFIGLRLSVIAFRKRIKRKKVKRVSLLGFAGGFADAFSGGGWGPIVTSTLLSSGKKSNYVVGTVSMSEFFVTFSASVVFFSVLGISHWHIIAGLILGGACAAPIAARLAGKMPQKYALLLVSALVITFSLRIVFRIFS
jgi:uncharacterized membrane protein YfcA